MNRFLQWMNLAGVCVLAIVCALQWQANRHLNLRNIDLENSRLQQAQALADKEKTIQGNIADMNDFRGRLIRSQIALQDAQGVIRANDSQLAQLTTRNSQLQAANESLQTNLEQWKSAVTIRDEAIQRAAAQTRQLTTDRNDAIVKFNELASRYNESQDQLKLAADEIKKLAADRNDTVTKFNELAEKYNALVKRLPAATQP